MRDHRIRNTLGALVAALTALAGASLAPLQAFSDTAPAEASAAETSAAARAFDRFRGLAGEWQGTNSHGDPVRLRYEVVADGSAVLEHLDVDGEERDHNMVTVYHLDGETLMLTHYCVGRNQPRMRAESLGDDEVRFELVDITGLESPDAGHMHRAEFRFADADHLTSAWTWRENGADTFTARIAVERLAGE